MPSGDTILGVRCNAIEYEPILNQQMMGQYAVRGVVTSSFLFARLEKNSHLFTNILIRALPVTKSPLHICL